MASQYDSEISGLMDRIQQLRDLRNVSSNQPETNTEPPTLFFAPAASFEVEQTTVDYSDGDSASRTDTPESEDFDQLSMRRADSLFPVVEPVALPAVAAQKVSVFSIADFMAHVPAAPVPVPVPVVSAVQAAEVPQEQLYDSGDSKEFDSSNAEIQFHVTENHNHNEGEGDLQQMLHQYNDLLAEVSSYEAAGPANELPYLQDALQKDGEVGAKTIEFTMPPEPEPVVIAHTVNVFQACMSPSIAHPEIAPSSSQSALQTNSFEPTGDNDLPLGLSPEQGEVATEQHIPGEAAEVEFIEEVPLPRVDVPVPIQLPAVVTTSTAETTAVDLSSADSPPQSRQRRSVATASSNGRLLSSSRRSSVDVWDKSTTKAAPSARRSSRSVSPKSAGATPTHFSLHSERDVEQIPRQIKPQNTQNVVVDQSDGATQQEGLDEVVSISPACAASPTEPRSQSPPQQRRSSQSQNTPSPPIAPRSQQQSRKPSPRPQQQPAYQLRVSGELDALMQYKAALFLQSQLVDKLIHAKSVVMEAATDEQRMRLQISVDITAELLQKSVLESEVLSCIVLGDVSPLPPPQQHTSTARPTSQQTQIAPHQSRSFAPSSAHSAVHSAHSASHRALSSWQPRSGSPTDSVGSTSTASNVSVIGGQRVDLVRRSPSGAINSTPLTGSLKRIPSVGTGSGGSVGNTLGTPTAGVRRSATPGGTATTVGSAPRSTRSARGTCNPTGSRTLFPASPQVSVDALRRNATLVHSLVGNIDNYCSCCRTKLVDMTSHKTSSLKHNQCRYCIHSH